MVIPLAVTALFICVVQWRWPSHMRVMLVLMLMAIVNVLVRITPLVAPLDSEVLESEFVVTTDPVQRVVHGHVQFAKEFSVHADVVQRDGMGARIPIVLTLNDPALSTALPTSRWRCSLGLEQTYVIHRYSAFGRCHSPPVLVQRASRYQDFAASLRNALAEMTYRRSPLDDAAALLPALVDGDTRGQSEHLTQALQQAGLGHVTAVSGANVAILFAALNFLLLRISASSSVRLAVQCAMLIGFVVIARPTPSVVRAAVMAAIALMYWWLGWRRYAEVIVLIAVVVLLVIDPWLAVSWGFALSVVATFALVVLPSLWGANQGNRFEKLFLTALAATLATVPLLIAMGTHPTFASIPANVFAEVFIAPATIAGFVCMVSAAASSVPVVGGLFHLIALTSAWTGTVCARAIIWISECVNRTAFSTAVISMSGALAIIGAATLAFRLRRFPKRQVVLVSVAALSISLVVTQRIEIMTNAWPLEQWDVVACDVGQGDATVVRTSEHSAIVVDAGGDENSIDNCLAQLGIEVIDLFVASHFHADHVGGIAGMVKNRRVLSALLPPQQSPVDGLRAVTAVVRNSRIAHVGDAGQQRAVHWQVLYVGSPIGNTDDGTTINNASVVLLITLHHHSVLLTGDIEIDAQSQLMKQVAQLHVDIVKIPHHGSRYQAPDFAAWSHPSLAWASVGADNPYGHPAIETLNTYRSIGAVVVTTRDCGSVAFRLSSRIEWRGSRSCHA